MTDSWPDDRQGRGGARGADARARLLAAGETEFLAHGFVAASTNRIVAEAGASKATLFRHYPTKRALFSAVVENGARRSVSNVASHLADIDDPERWLAVLARAVLDAMLEPTTTRLMRLLVLEAPRTPELSALFAVVGPPQFLTILSARLYDWSASGTIETHSTERAGRLFFDMLCGGVMMRSLIHQQPTLSPIERQAHAEACAAMAMAAWRPRRRSIEAG